MEENYRRFRLNKISSWEEPWIWVISPKVSKNFEIAQYEG